MHPVRYSKFLLFTVYKIKINRCNNYFYLMYVFYYNMHNCYTLLLLLKLCVCWRFSWQLLLITSKPQHLLKTTFEDNFIGEKHKPFYKMRTFQILADLKLWKTNTICQYLTKQNNDVFQQDVNPLHYPTSVRFDINFQASGLRIMNLFMSIL